MKEFLVISGKGGTGKTSIVGSFAVLAENKVLVDSDVDAADLHLLLHPSVQQTREFYGSKKATIDGERCTRCDRCAEVCRFDAIDDYMVNPLLCEGCGACHYVCPSEAVRLEPKLSGHWFVSDTRYGPLVHAKLGIAEENSGKLVSEVRRAARALAQEGEYRYIITDGPPGTGCPVISSMSGVDLALIITEPTVAGVHDLKRILQLTSHFGIRSMVCINKYDINETGSDEIEAYCSENGIGFAGRIPFDEEVVRAAIDGVPLIEHSQGEAARGIRAVWDTVAGQLAE